MAEPGSFYEYQPGGSGIPVLVLIERIAGDVAFCVMRIGARSPSPSYIKSGVHVGRLGRLLTEEEAKERGWSYTDPTKRQGSRADPQAENNYGP